MFTVTNNVLSEAIREVYKRGVKVRIVTDDVCCKMLGSDIYKLAALGIQIKTDNHVRNQMHHKYAVIDNCVLLTGSFNWTAKAVNQNQENILILEDKGMANRYTDEFNRMWAEFVFVNANGGLSLISNPSYSNFDLRKILFFMIICIYLVLKFLMK